MYFADVYCVQGISKKLPTKTCIYIRAETSAHTCPHFENFLLIALLSRPLG